MLSAASSLCLPLAIGWTFDTVGAGAASGGAVTPEARAAITALFVTLAAAAACNAINFALAGLISQRAGHRLRSQLFEVLIAREQSFFDATHKVGPPRQLKGWGCPQAARRLLSSVPAPSCARRERPIMGLWCVRAISIPSQSHLNPISIPSQSHLNPMSSHLVLS
jgi:ABC-type multidrug transport system fused ATPase/permease subunit